MEGSIYVASEKQMIPATAGSIYMITWPMPRLQAAWGQLPYFSTQVNFAPGLCGIEQSFFIGPEHQRLELNKTDVAAKCSGAATPSVASVSWDLYNMLYVFNDVTTAYVLCDLPCY